MGDLLQQLVMPFLSRGDVIRCVVVIDHAVPLR
ncbi:hypothetical protein QE414_000739 [Microbacterium sp. SORGH_AS 344]|nr:hypothetical protein [Microbacterium sp. SORGH_AS_0344]